MIEPSTKERILSAIRALAGQATTKAIEEKVGVERHTLAKYLALMRKEGLVDYDLVGQAKVWSVSEAPLQNILDTPEEFGYAERVLYTILRKLPIGVILCDENGVVTFMSDSLQERFGGRSGNVCDVLQVDSPELADLLAGDVERIFIDVETEDGVLEICGVRSAESGAAVMLSIQDITHRRKAEERRARLAAIVDGSPDAVIVKTIDGTIIEWNASAERMYGYTRHEALGKHISFIVPSSRREELDDVFARILAGERIDRLETVRIDKAGRKMPVLLSISPIRVDGKITAFAAMAQDLSELRKYAEMAEAREKG